jgi:hypothetical protein
MNTKLMDEAHDRWSSGESLEVGRLIYEQLHNNDRPVWAAAILDLCRPLIPKVPEIEAIYEIALSPSRWKEAHAAFQRVRELTLKAERSKSTNAIYAGILHVAENAAKIAYNASIPGRSDNQLFSAQGPAPFDHDAGWWIVSNLRHVANTINDPTFEERAWAIVSGSA